jgi:hypothetical protein
LRRTPILLAAVSLVAAATPAALLAHPSDKGKGPETEHPSKGPKAPQHPKGKLHLLNACVIADATATGVDLRVLSANRHMRDVLDGATTFSAKLDAATKIRLVGKARALPKGSTPKRLPKIGTWDNLDLGDRVTVRWRVEPGLDAASMPAAWKVTDRGPSKKCALPTTEPKKDQPAPTAPSL